MSKNGGRKVDRNEDEDDSDDSDDDAVEMEDLNRRDQPTGRGAREEV